MKGFNRRRAFIITILALLLCGCSNPEARTTAPEIAEDSIWSTQKHLLNLSKQKWEWMAEKNVAKLAELFDERSKFVHMGGTWRKGAELDIIESGSIWYKNADIHDSTAEIFGDTGIVWNLITLDAVVREMEVSNRFTVTEVYQYQNGTWKLLDLTFSSVRDEHAIAK